MNTIGFGISGEFILSATDAVTKKTRQLARFRNLITNGGIERFLSGTGAGGSTVDRTIHYVQVGSGNAPPTVNDSTLQNYIAGTSRNFNVQTTNTGAPDYKAVYTFGWQFDVGAAAGNLSEVGVGWQPSGSLFSRALILDSNGNPTTITVLSSEYLDVRYIVRVRPLTTDATGTINLAGTDYSYIIRAARADMFNPNIYHGIARINRSNAAAYTGDIGGITGQPSGTNLWYAGSVTWQPYQAGSMMRKILISATQSQWNHASGIRSILLDLDDISPSQYQHVYQIQFTPAIPKTDTQSLNLEFGITLNRE